MEIFGGYNAYAQPNYRFQWGMDARGFLNGDPFAMKYGNPNDTTLGYACWMLERIQMPVTRSTPRLSCGPPTTSKRHACCWRGRRM